jgi:hypothetical protein
MQRTAKDGNEVHKQTIWSETIRKEMAHRTERTIFSINNTQLKKTVLTEPVSVRPKRFLDKDTIMLESVTRQLKGEPFRDARSARLDHLPALPPHLTRTLTEPAKLPTEKYDAPNTSSQEVGWVSKTLIEMPKNSRFYHPKNTCDITRYAAHIISSSHLDPFTKSKKAAGH